MSAPLRIGLNWDEKWKAEDKGLIACWERGRGKAAEDPALSDAARNGQLVLLPWKGGVEKSTKKNEKFGTFSYLAMWQGLRGEDLDVDPDHEVVIFCSVTGMKVTFTSDRDRYAPASEEEGEP